MKRFGNLLSEPFSFASVGITGLEPATSRPPDVCATNCAKSRTLNKSCRTLNYPSAKVWTFDEKNKYLKIFFVADNAK